MQYLITECCASSPYTSFSFFPSMKRRRFEVLWDYQRLDCPLQSEVNLLLLLLWLHYPRMMSPSLLSVFHPPTSCAACPHLRKRSFLKRDRYLEPNMKKWMDDERINVMLQFVVIFCLVWGWLCQWFFNDDDSYFWTSEWLFRRVRKIAKSDY
jgi:hypothetical protein